MKPLARKSEGIKKQRRLDHKRAGKDSTSAVGVHASNVASPACKDLSHLSCFNSDKKGHYATNCPKPRKDRDTSEDYTQGNYSQTSPVHLVPYHRLRKSVLALLNSKSGVNNIYPIFAKELGLQVRLGAPWDAFQYRSAGNRRHHAGYLWNGSQSNLSDGQVLEMPFLTLTGVDVNSYMLNGVCVQKKRQCPWPTNFILTSSHQYWYLRYCTSTLWPHPGLSFILLHLLSIATRVFSLL